MVDLKKVRRRGDKPAPTDPRRIFDRLPKPEGVNDLWESQGEVLRTWHERREQRDVVIKLNTGGGKTLVGFLVAQSLMNEHRIGALYLCANTQLVDQTLAKAREFQLPAVEYETGSRPLPVDFSNGEAILVATYRALFHGYSKFGIRGQAVPVRTSVIVCDDSHTAFADIRNAFSVVVSKKRHSDLYLDITARFRDAAEAVNRLGTYDRRVGGQDLGVFEVPYWAWKEQAAGVRELLERHVRGSEYEYQLPLLLDAFHAAHVLIRSTEVAITPILPLVDLLPTFTEAPHRVFMSATIADDSSLIRTFDADEDAVRSPIAPASLAGVGERMILAPALTPVGVKDELTVARALCERVAARGLGVVVLVPSEVRAKRWEGAGTLVMKDEVAKAVEALNDRSSGDNGPYIFANRYDGIDLANDACRLLVLDGLPQGANAYDEYRATALRGSSQIELSLAQRVEQGMGRGTRGAGDYCVVLLLANLVDWVSRRGNAALMTAATRVQLELGLDVSKVVENVEDLDATVGRCLDREPDWVGTHAEELADRAVESPPPDESAISAATVERRYVAQYAAGDYEKAFQIAREAAAAHSDDRLFRGWLLQLAARAAYFRGHTSESVDLQTEAAKANPNFLAPPGRSVTESLAPVGGQARNLAVLVDSYAQRAGFLASLDRATLPLTGKVPAGIFEEAIGLLGTHLGFSSDRLDRGSGTGPDNVWRTDDGRVFVISCKNEKSADSPLFKKDLQQLLIDAEWIKEQYPELRRVPVVIQPTAEAVTGLPLKDIRVLTFEGLGRIVAAVLTISGELAASSLTVDGLEGLAAKLLLKHSLTPAGFIEAYLQPFTAKQKTASKDGA